MVKLTPRAARQILAAVRQAGPDEMPLRVAVTTRDDGSFHYAMGLDDVPSDEDFRFHSEGVEIVVSKASMPLLNGLVIDYVELDAGQFNFIFLNPNDPSFVPPEDLQDEG